MYSAGLKLKTSLLGILRCSCIYGVYCRPAGYGFGEIGAPVTDEELPPEAHHTLFMSGLPLDMQKREATHIFRPFEGYKAGPRLMLRSN